MSRFGKMSLHGSGCHCPPHNEQQAIKVSVNKWENTRPSENTQKPGDALSAPFQVNDDISTEFWVWPPPRTRTQVQFLNELTNTNETVYNISNNYSGLVYKTDWPHASIGSWCGGSGRGVSAG
jgi:hypothetical protein